MSGLRLSSGGGPQPVPTPITSNESGAPGSVPTPQSTVEASSAPANAWTSPPQVGDLDGFPAGGDRGSQPMRHDDATAGLVTMYDDVKFGPLAEVRAPGAPDRSAALIWVQGTSVEQAEDFDDALEIATDKAAEFADSDLGGTRVVVRTQHDEWFVLTADYFVDSDTTPPSAAELVATQPSVVAVVDANGAFVTPSAERSDPVPQITGAPKPNQFERRYSEYVVEGRSLIERGVWVAGAAVGAGLLADAALLLGRRWTGVRVSPQVALGVIGGVATAGALATRPWEPGGASRSTFPERELGAAPGATKPVDPELSVGVELARVSRSDAAETGYMHHYEFLDEPHLDDHDSLDDALADAERRMFEGGGTNAAVVKREDGTYVTGYAWHVTNAGDEDEGTAAADSFTISASAPNVVAIVGPNGRYVRPGS